MSNDVLAYLAAELRGMHGLYERVTVDLDDRQFNHVPAGGHQNIAFCLWHYVRTEDNVIHWVFQGKRTVWLEGGWDAKFSLDPKAQGTGFTDDEARAFRVKGAADFREYMLDVFRKSEEYVGALTAAEAARRVTIKPLGEMTVLQAVSGMCVTHGYRHLGEIEFAKGLVAPRGGSTI
jgi:hypothetical protein